MLEEAFILLAGCIGLMLAEDADLGDSWALGPWK